MDDGKRHYLKQVCKNAENGTSTTLEAILLTQRKDNFRFVLHSAFRMFYGSALRRVNAYATDGDSNLYDVVEGLRGKFGMDFHRVRCRWHAVIKPFAKHCPFNSMDGGLALTVLDQVSDHALAYAASTIHTRAHCHPQFSNRGLCPHSWVRPCTVLVVLVLGAGC